MATAAAGKGAAAGTDDGKGGAPADDGKTTEQPAAGTGKGSDDKKEPDAGDGSQAAGKDGAQAEQPKPAVKYELKAPANGRLDATDLQSVEAIAKAEGWTPEEAQRRIDEHAAAIDAQTERFLEETTADPTYGGEKLEATQKLAKTALDKLRPAGTPRGDALRRMLDKSGYGNNLEVISLLADLGKLMAEDAPIGGDHKGGAATKKTAEELLYKS